MADINNQLIAVFAAQQISNNVAWSASALVVYEHFVSFGREVELFWRGKDITGATVLFFLNRYLMLLYNLFSLYSFTPFVDDHSTYVTRLGLLDGHSAFIHVYDDTSCSQSGVRFIYATRAIETLGYIPWGAFSALRVFALTGGNKTLAITVFLLSTGTPLAINFAIFHWIHGINDPVFGCVMDDSISASLSLKFVITSRSSIMAADLIVIAVTWFTTYKTAAMARVAFNRKDATFSVLLLRDGIIYFILMLIMNALHLAFSESSVLLTLDGGNISDITQFTGPITTILVSRFMLNLQETKQRTAGGASESVTASSVRFDRIVGSIGESLGPSVVESDFEVEDSTEDGEEPKDRPSNRIADRHQPGLDAGVGP